MLLALGRLSARPRGHARLLSLSAKPPPLSQPLVPHAYRRLLPKKKAKRARNNDAVGLTAAFSGRVSAHMMANAHDPVELASTLRARFGAGSVNLFDGVGASDAPALSSVGLREIEGVVHLSAPNSGSDAPHGSPPASVFFFTGSEQSDEFASASTCVSVWWGAEPSFEDALLRDLQAVSRPKILTKQQQLDRLAVPRAVMKWQPGSRSELSRDEVIIIDGAAAVRSTILDQLAFSHALQRHMRLLLLEEEMERILLSVKRIVRQGLGPSFVRPLRRLLPRTLGGLDSGHRTMQRLLLMREFNFDSDVMSTPDWLWEQPAREAMYDDLVAAHEIVDRIESINQQLDYAQGTMQSLKDDAQHQHSTFLEWTIVLLIAFEVVVEMHALGWIQWPGWLAERGWANEPPNEAKGRHS